MVRFTGEVEREMEVETDTRLLQGHAGIVM